MGFSDFLFGDMDRAFGARAMFDSEWRQRRDIDLQGEALDEVSSGAAATAQQVAHLKETVFELSVTVRLLMTKLAAAGQLDAARLRTELDEELKGPRHQRRSAAVTKVRCVRCDAEGMSNEMVHVGSDIWCRPCAKNP